jgi:hypothetical protein
MAGAAPTSADVRAIADELLDERAALTRRLLGHGADGAPTSPGGAPSPAMLRAIGAAGLPIPPGSLT